MAGRGFRFPLPPKLIEYHGNLLMRFIDQLLSAVDMTASERTVEINGKDFTFFVTPLTSAERERALKAIGSNEITPANAGRYTMGLILSKVRDANGQRLFTDGDGARLRNELPSDVIDQLAAAVQGSEKLEEDELTDMKSAEPETKRNGKKG